MPLSPTLVWEVRQAGDPSNGGAYRAGATGADYSQQDAAQVSYTDLSVDAATNTKVTSAANPFTATHVGNVIKVSSGAPWTPGYYEVVSVASGAATLDRSPAPASSTGGVGKLGGASNSLESIASSVVSSNRVWVKQGTYTHAVGATFTAGPATISPSSPPCRIYGYGTTRGDGGRATINAGASVNPIVVANRTSVGNFNIAGGNVGIYGGTRCHVFNCKISGTTQQGINLSATFGVVESCEVTGAVSQAGIGVNSGTVFGCHVHDNATTGIVLVNGGSAIGNLAANNTGAASDGITGGDSAVVVGNTVYGSGRHGYNRSGSATSDPGITHNNLFINNGGYGLLFASAAGLAATPMHDSNAYYNNTSGARSNGADTTVNPQNGSGFYTNPLDKVLIASPFINAAGGDFRLNNTAGGGALCRAAAIPSSWPGSSLASYEDMGAAQHPDSGGTGGRVIGSGVIQPSRKLA